MHDRFPAQQAAPRRLPLGSLWLDLDAGELVAADGEPAALRRQALEVLLLLGRRAGQVVAKDELMQQVWPGVVVGEGSLTQAVADIRRVLGDAEHRLVRNVARRGYRLVPDRAASPAAEARADAPTPACAAATEPATADTASTTPSAAAAAAGAIAADAGGASGQPPAARSSWPGRRAVGADAVSQALWLVGGVVAVLALALLAAARWSGGNAAPPWQSPADVARQPLGEAVPPLSVVVLPLTVEGAAADAQWLADALHGDLVIEVARLQGSLVIARDTAATYKGRAVDPRQVARELGVRHVVQGTLRQEGTTIRLGLALVDGDSGVQRWAETFTTERAELARSAADFAVAVERTLAGALWRSTVERRARLASHEVSADDLAMQGFALWYRGVTRDNVVAARALFDRAVALDPDSARGWAGVHFTTTNLLLNGWAEDRAAALRRAEESAANLERVDRDGSYTYSAKTFQLFLKRDYPAMRRHTEEWSTRYRLPLAFGAHGAALILGGQFDEAVPVIERALRLGPRDPFRYEWQYRLATAHFGAGRYELAREWSQAAANTNPAAAYPPVHAAALHRLGRSDEARRAFDEFTQRHPGFHAGQVLARLPGTEPAHAEMRERLLASLRALGMRD